MLLLTPSLRARPEAPVLATVYVFLVDTCPICRNATLVLRELAARYSPRGIRFVGVFLAPHMRPADVVVFQKYHELRETLAALVAHRSIPVAHNEAVGCLIEGN